MSEKLVHHGKAVKRIREILGKKQEDLATDLGMTQQNVSLLESKEIIDPKVLDDVAKALKITPDTIRNFTEDAAVQIIANSFTSNDNSTLYGINYQPTFNPLDKIIELYERMIKERDELIAKLQEKK